MLYIFNMDQGRMLTFEMTLALETVQSLTQAIERQYGIPASSQVLLVSGGETLELSNRVCSYSAGTDTNPIFMFSSDLEQRNPPAPWPSIENDTDLKAEVDRCLELRAEYKTVVQRAQLAQTFYDLGKEELKFCDKLVHEQHLQHQGWMAVIANMEDITFEFSERCSDFDRVFKDHIEKRIEYKDYLESFDEDLGKLSQIPILPPLIQGAEEQPFHAFDDVYADADETFAGKLLQSGVENAHVESTSSHGSSVKEDEAATMKDSNPKSSLTLLQWISSSENQKALKRMAENCTRELEVFDTNVMETLKDEIEKTVESARREDMKEIKGLEERLRGLENLMFDARKIVQEQNDLAQSFSQNQARAANLGDQSILPDLCASHRSQLIVMLKNHKKLRDIRGRCGKAKDELGKNLYQRLKFVIHVENKMYEIDSKLLFYHTCLRRLQKHLGIIEQIHQAPCVYVQAVTEVVRRRIFSTAFLMWASDLACHLLTIYNEEVLRRQEFRYSFDGHFLNTLFPGIDDFPPKFATEAPSIFDSNLPQLSKSDLGELSRHLPDLTKKIQLPNLSAIIDFFSSRSSNSNQETTSTTDENVNPSNKKLMNVFAQIKDFERGFESETDTEEYEKIGQTSIDKPKPLTHQSMGVMTSHAQLLEVSTSMEAVAKQDAEIMTDDNMGSGLEVERLRQLLVLMHRASQESVVLLRQQISSIKADATNEKEAIQAELDNLLRSWGELKAETKNHERELVQRLTVDHELEMNDLRQSLYVKDDEINTLRSEKVKLESGIRECEDKFKDEKALLEKTLHELQQKVQELELKITQQTAQREASVKEVREKLTNDHRNEIESLRCKFKLMTSMERSPSDTSLEKIERPDIIDIASHEAIINQMKDNFEEEMKIEVGKAIEKERSTLKLSESTSKLLIAPSSPSRSPRESQEIFRRILDEKDRQLDQMREREQYLMKETMRLKETIQSLTDIELNESQLSLYKEKLETVQNEKKKLEKDLEKEKSKRAKLSAIAHGTGGITINSCSKDDVVLIVWNSAHEQYTVVQDSTILYFLHAESYNDMKLVAVAPSTYPRISFCIGKVTDKEYCHAKKDENRYKVGKGTKFYRVKVRPKSPSMDKSMTLEKKRSRKSVIDMQSSHSETQSESSKYMKQERQPSLLIDSFAQTDTHNALLDTATGGSSSDMIDSGVHSQHKGEFKERNVSVTEDDDCLSFSEDRFRDKDIIVSEEEDEVDKPAASSGVIDRKDEPDEAMTMKDQATIEGELASLDDSDEYRSLEGKDDEDTEL